jgi:hypothetical protein
VTHHTPQAKAMRQKLLFEAKIEIALTIRDFLSQRHFYLQKCPLSTPCRGPIFESFAKVKFQETDI